MADKYILEIQNAIEKAAIDGALTKDAIGQFNSLIEHTDALETNAIHVDKIVQRQEVQIKQMTTELEIARGLNEVAAKMEAGLILREQAITKLEAEAKHQGERVKDHKEMFAIVFRNLEVRRNVFTPAPGSSGVDQYGTALPAGYVDEHEQKEKTE